MIAAGRRRVCLLPHGKALPSHASRKARKTALAAIALGVGDAPVSAAARTS